MNDMEPTLRLCELCGVNRVHDGFFVCLACHAEYIAAVEQTAEYEPPKGIEGESTCTR